MEIASGKKRQKAVKRKSRYKRRRQDIWNKWSLVVICVILTGLVLYSVLRGRPGKLIPDLGNQHILPPAKAEYNSYPPTSGPHYAGLAPWGIHEKPIPNELQVHNLEDGGVMVQYNCPDGCAELVSQLAELVDRYDRNIILAPYPDMEYRIALTAWNRLETLQAFDEKQITMFINQYTGLDHHK